MTLDSEEEPVPYNQGKAAEVKLNIGNSSMTGAFIFSYPITVPPGRNGMQPDLKLVYNSQSGQEGDILGYGWGTNIPYIERINREGIEDLYTKDYFNSSLSGELIKTSTSSSPEYGAKVENGDFLKYVYVNKSYWLVTDKTGKTYKFGADIATRQNDHDNASSTFKWMLEEVRDTNGNYIKYEYYKDNGQIYPQTITYTGHDSTDGIFDVEFTRESRADNATSSMTGFAVATNYRISEIKTEMNDSWIGKYKLDYVLGDNNVRSMLSSTTPSFRDEFGNITALPPTEFIYQTKIPGWELNDSWSLPSTDGLSGSDNGLRFAEINGDGLIDIIIGGYDDGNLVHDVYINSGKNSWGHDSNYVFSFNFSNGEAVLADVNGDGLDDIVAAKDNQAANGVYINNGDATGWTKDNDYTVPVNFSDSSPGGSDTGARFADVNGDGLVDIVTNSNVYVNKGDGTGWENVQNWGSPHIINLGESRLTDVNGDGLADFLYAPYNDTGKVYINTGSSSGWVYEPRYSIPVAFRGLILSDNVGVDLVDVNGDGLVDITRRDYDHDIIYINKGDGTGWSSDGNWLFPQDTTDVKANRMLDVNGDGLADFVYKEFDEENSYIYINNAGDPDLISEIDYGTGAIASMEYLGSAQYLDESADNLLNPKNPLSLTTLRKITINDGFGNLSTTTYEYSGGLYYYNNEYDRRFAGFQKVKVIDSLGNYTLGYYHQGDTSSSTIGEYQDDQSKIGNIYRTETYDKNDSLYTKSVYKIVGCTPFI